MPPTEHELYDIGFETLHHSLPKPESELFQHLLVPYPISIHPKNGGYTENGWTLRPLGAQHVSDSEVPLVQQLPIHAAYGDTIVVLCLSVDISAGVLPFLVFLGALVSDWNKCCFQLN